MAAFFDGRAGVAGGCTFGARDEATLVAGRCGLVGFADLRAGFGAGVLRELGMI